MISFFRLLFLPGLLLLLSLAPASGPVTWLTPTEHDFGDIMQGEPVRVDFRLRNDGDEPLVIDNVRPSCGCTTPDWPREPIFPDSTATIAVAYNAKIKGYFRKQIKVFFDGRGAAEKLFVEGYVE
jgi:hypothetical protein